MSNEKTLVLSSQNFRNFGFVGDSYFYQASDYPLGEVKTAVDKSLQYTAPVSNNNEFYSCMLGAQAIDFYSVVEGDTYDNGESWYKILTNAVSAHLNGAKGTYNFNLEFIEIGVTSCFYIYKGDGTLVSSSTTGESNASFQLDYGQTYYVRITTDISAPYFIRFTYDNVGGISDSATTEMVQNSLYLSHFYSGFNSKSRIKKAEITLYQKNCTNNADKHLKLGVYNYDSGVNPDFSIAEVGNLCDYTVIKKAESDETVSYTLDVTNIVKKSIANNYPNFDVVVKPIGTSLNEDCYISIFADGEYRPKLSITYENGCGAFTSNEFESHQMGFFGQGNIDLQYGYLMFESEDFAWKGNRMPVTIKHLYTSELCSTQYTANSSKGLNIADFSAMKLGYGYKLNIMQSIVKTADDKYIYSDENGNETYFTVSENEPNVFVSSKEDGELSYNESTRILENGEKYLFDESGRLIKIIDENENTTQINYTDGKIMSVIDSANREFIFTYNDKDFLESITAPDGTQVTYTYKLNSLTTVNYPEGKRAEITYSNAAPASVMLYDADVPVYKIEYTGSSPFINKVKEYGYKDGVAKVGITKTYEYFPSQGKTIVTSSETSLNTVYVFDNDGNILSEYLMPIEDVKEPMEDGKCVTTVNNVLTGHNFENFSDNWSIISQDSSTFTVEVLEDENVAKFGKNYLRITSTDQSAVCRGIYQSFGLPGDDYTFSAYIRIVSGFEGENDGVYLRISRGSGNELIAQSEKLKIKDEEFVRISASFTYSLDSYRAEILLDGAGVVEINAPQFEGNTTANSYNMLSDSEINSGDGWNLDNAEYYDCDGFRWYGAIKIDGDIDNKKSSGQTVSVKSNKATRESFKLSGWAKGYALPSRDSEQSPTFRLRAVINYTDGTTTQKPITADFCPYIEDWQYTSVEFSKDAYKEVQNIEIFCDYDYNCSVAYFDDIALIRTGIETELTEDDFVIENAEETTENETEGISNTENAQEEADEFKELLDSFGNTLTETNFTDGEYGTIYRSFGYDQDGNNLVKETDSCGNVTEYAVDGVTSRNEQVTDRLGNKTAYTYDNAGRTTKIISKTAEDYEMATVSYAYDSFDNITEIVRGDGLKYVLKYNAFHNLESIGIDGKTDGDLINYTYKTGSGRLKAMQYANGDKMSATYNGYGLMIAEKWEDKDGNQTAYYKYAYDSQGEIIRTIDITAQRMYNYTYDNGRIDKAVETVITVDEYDVIKPITVLSTIRYYYDNDGTLIKKRIITADGEQVVTYKTAENESQMVKTEIGEDSFVSTSKNDSFGRKEFDELQLGSGFVSRKFDYLNGSITEEHKENKLLKSTPTTELVSEITFSDGRTIDYEYDAEERITKVTDSLEGVTEYVYDALGQLLLETKNGQVINAMTYDNYGNILSKNGIGYEYNAIWKDRLSHCGGEEISYDAQGNPLNYLGHILFWEKGRQLRSFDNSIYTYNASGIRTSKTVDNVRHDFRLDGAKILSETWDNNVLMPLYDNEDTVCGIVYNGVSYYFQKNLQGDIIAICDKQGETVARYTYDAWGKCTIESDYKNAVIAKINPFRYRGYYYDSETGMYYLQSRYYDPSVGRFVNGDEAEFAVFKQGALSHNLFGYCENEPVGRKDDFGYAAIVIGGITISAGALYAILVVIGFLWLYATNSSFRESINQLLTNFVMGVINGVGYLVNVLDDAIDKAKKNYKKYNSYEVHHIVAQKEQRAKITRNLIKKYGISTSVKQNKVSIKKKLHKHIHTNAYHAAVYLILKSAESKKGSWFDKRQRLLACLVLIGALLRKVSNSI